MGVRRLQEAGTISREMLRQTEPHYLIPSPLAARSFRPHRERGASTLPSRKHLFLHKLLQRRLVTADSGW